MPCIDHYPSDSEMRQDRINTNEHRIEVAKLTCFAAQQLRKKEHPTVTAIIALRRTPESKLLADCAPILCKLLTDASTKTLEKVLYGDPKNRMARKLADWWEEHQEADKERLEREAKESERKAEIVIRLNGAKDKIKLWLKANKKELAALPKLLTIPLGSKVLVVKGDLSRILGRFTFITGSAIRDHGVEYSTVEGPWVKSNSLILVALPTKASLQFVVTKCQDEDDDEEEEDGDEDEDLPAEAIED